MMLAGLAAAAARCGSLILALALAEREIEAERALALAETDEDYQARRWGVDPAYEARREAIRRDIASAARFMELCRG
jgi:chaperone required for assembly of F1-ATPase